MLDMRSYGLNLLPTGYKWHGRCRRMKFLHSDGEALPAATRPAATPILIATQTGTTPGFRNALKFKAETWVRKVWTRVACDRVRPSGAPGSLCGRRSVGRPDPASGVRARAAPGRSLRRSWRRRLRIRDAMMFGADAQSIYDRNGTPRLTRTLTRCSSGTPPASSRASHRLPGRDPALLRPALRTNRRKRSICHIQVSPRRTGPSHSARVVILS
jgi:hypothetical protein